MFTYSIALFVPAFISIVVPPMFDYKHKLSWIVLIFFVLFVEIVLVVWSENVNNCLLPAILSTILSWVFWVIANSENPLLIDESYDRIIKNGEAKHGKGW
jgi:drug/metabolite transporter (DMT)-like permease